MTKLLISKTLAKFFIEENIPFSILEYQVTENKLTIEMEDFQEGWIRDFGFGNDDYDYID